jgi:hypothetical protein
LNVLLAVALTLAVEQAPPVGKEAPKPLVVVKPTTPLPLPMAGPGPTTKVVNRPLRKAACRIRQGAIHPLLAVKGMILKRHVR